MKLTNIALYSNGIEVAEFSFRDAAANNPYSVAGITGLDADVIVPKYYGTNISGNTKFHNPAMGVRDIAMRIVFDPQWASGKGPSELRDDLYRAIASSRTGQVELRFRDGSKVKAVAHGFVTIFDTDHFAPSPSVNLTIRCPDGLLTAATSTVVDTSGMNNAFNIVDTQSTAQHGLRFVIGILGVTPTFRIHDPVGDHKWEFEAAPTRGFIDGDTLYFSSVDNDRYFYVVSSVARGSETIHMADSITIGSLWPKVFPGPNSYEIDAPSIFTWYSLEHTPTYWGV